MKIVWHGEAIRRAETVWPHCELFCCTTNTSQVSNSPAPPHPSLSSILHQVLPPINKDIGHQARNLRRLIPFQDGLCIISSQNQSHKDAGQPEVILMLGSTSGRGVTLGHNMAATLQTVPAPVTKPL